MFRQRMRTRFLITKPGVERRAGHGFVVFPSGWHGRNNTGTLQIGKPRRTTLGAAGAKGISLYSKLMKPCGGFVIFTTTTSAIASSTQLAVVNSKAETKEYPNESSAASETGMLKVKQTIRLLGSSRISAASKMAFDGQNNATLPPVHIHVSPSRVARYTRNKHAKMRAYCRTCNVFNVMIAMPITCALGVPKRLRKRGEWLFFGLVV
jgi:hypothetical protein